MFLIVQYCFRCEDILFQVQRAKAGLMNAPLIEILKEVCLSPTHVWCVTCCVLCSYQ